MEKSLTAMRRAGSARTVFFDANLENGAEVPAFEGAVGRFMHILCLGPRVSKRRLAQPLCRPGGREYIFGPL